MKINEDFKFNQRVRINMPHNILLDGETAVVIGWEEDNSLKVRFEVYKPEFDSYEDTATGSVIVEAIYLEMI